METSPKKFSTSKKLQEESSDGKSDDSNQNSSVNSDDLLNVEGSPKLSKTKSKFLEE